MTASKKTKSRGSFMFSKNTVTINKDSTKCYFENPESQFAIDFLNKIAHTSPVLDYNQIRTIELPQIKDFKEKIKIDN